MISYTQLAASFPQVDTVHFAGCDYYDWDTHWYMVNGAPVDDPTPPFGDKVRHAKLLFDALEDRIKFGHYGPTALPMGRLM